MAVGTTASATAAGTVSSTANSSERFWLSITASWLLGAQVPRHVRQQHDADGDADDGQRQLVEAIGVVEVGHGAVLHRGDDGADDDVDLRHAAGDDARNAET